MTRNVDMIPIKHHRADRETAWLYAPFMPLTLSHPAVVLPLRRLGLPLTVLAIASMVPDLPLFMGWARGYEATHSALGIVTVDLVAAIATTAWWTFVMRDPLVDLAPSPIRSRLPAHARLSRRDWALTPLAAVVGAASHVVWDAFTHHGRWGVEHIAWLRAEHAGLAGSQWAQHASGIIGLVIVVAAALAHIASTPVETRRPHRALPAATLSVVVALGAAVAVMSAVRHARPVCTSWHSTRSSTRSSRSARHCCS